MATVYVNNGDIEYALVMFKRKIGAEGILREYKSKMHFETTREKRIRKERKRLKNKNRR